MAHQQNGYQGTPHGSPPSNQNHNHDLIRSLISPGPGTPLQQSFPPWGAQIGWLPNISQGNFGYGMQYQDSLNQNAWQQNAQSGYNQPEYDDDDEMITVDDTDILRANGEQSTQNAAFGNHIEMLHTPQQIRPGQLPSVSSSFPPTLPRTPLSNIVNDGPSSETNASSVNRAAELRAKLLASRASNAASRQQSPAVKTSDLNEAKKQNVQRLFKQTNKVLANELESQQAPITTDMQVSADKQLDGASISTTARSSGNTITNNDFAFLFADAQNQLAADAQKPANDLTNSNADILKNVEPLDSTNGICQLRTAANDPKPALGKNSPGSELSEPGEIRSGTSTPTKPPAMSRLEAEKADQATEDTREKLMRQHEVSKIYQPLKESKAPTSAPRVSDWEKPSSDSLTKANWRAPNERYTASSVKATGKQPYKEHLTSSSGHKGAYEHPYTQEEPRRNQQRERIREPNKREDERDIRRSSMPQIHSKSSGSRAEVEAYRQKMTEDNSRRAAEYKKSLEAQGFPVRQATAESSKSGKEAQQPANEPRPSQVPTSTAAGKDLGRSNTARTSNQKQNSDSDEGEPDSDNIMLSLTTQPVQGDSDMNDWLELTDYYNIEMREKRLKLFRKKRKLEIEKAEIEREELELQSLPLVARAPSVLPASVSPNMTRAATANNVRMPPPPPRLITANNDVGIKIKDTALSASENTTPTNKRQIAEEDSDSKRMQPAEKIARTDTKGRASNEKPLISPTSVRTAKEEPIPLESRISREYGDRYGARPRLRSRSPEVRRRSRSPLRRRYSEDYSPEHRPGYFDKNLGGVKREHHTCFKCGQPGHHQHQCTEPRRYGKESTVYREPPRDGKEYTTSSGYQKWVSPNYLGRNPLGRGGREGNRSPHNRPGDTRSRYDPGKQEDAEMSGSGDNIGSGPLDLGAGDTRYFMIKSWNSENVEIAQRDCTWATQEKNLVLLTEAYHTSRHIILFFSVNNSRAFQGYARMSSAPSIEIPPPAWTKNLLWTPTPPFRIEWFCKAYCRFSRIGHLKNSFNEGQPVLVGRDGQEIEEECGRRLAAEIDDVGGVGMGVDERGEGPGEGFRGEANGHGNGNGNGWGGPSGHFQGRGDGEEGW